MENTLTRKKQIITAKALTTVIGITLSVAIPQLFHVIGIVSGTGSLPGSAFLPMHLGVFFTALLAGPAVGAVTGAVSPLLSFALTGMPSAALLPFMMIEPTVYGVVCGLLKNKKIQRRSPEPQPVNHKDIPCAKTDGSPQPCAGVNTNNEIMKSNCYQVTRGFQHVCGAIAAKPAKKSKKLSCRWTA